MYAPIYIYMYMLHVYVVIHMKQSLVSIKRLFVFNISILFICTNENIFKLKYKWWLNINLVQGEVEGKEKENPTKVEMKTNFYVLHWGIMSLEELREFQGIEAKWPKGTQFFDESAQGK